MDKSHLHCAIDLLESIKGKVMIAQQREKTAVELAGYMLEEANQIQTRSEKKQQAQLARMMHDPRGKAFTTSMTDQCFRSHRSSRIANQMVYLLNSFGIPRYLDLLKRVELGFF